MTRNRLILVALVLILAVGIGYCFIKSHDNGKTPVPAENITGPLSVYFWNVGQGDCILIDYNEYECVIDSGDGTTNIDTKLKPYIDGPIEDVVLTHPHADHFGGFPLIFDEFKVLNFWDNSEDSPSKSYRTSMATINEEAGITKHIAVVGGLTLTDGLAIDIIKTADPKIDVNNDSIVLQVTYGSTKFLFMGDVGFDGEQYLMENQLVHDVDVLKVGHHGSCGSTSAMFLLYTKPEIAVYSAGVGNSYGHPCPDTLQRLTDAGATIYGTDNSGTIVVSSNGTGIGIRTLA